MRMIKHAFGSLLRGTLALIAASKERRAIRELQSFDGRTLSDIGIKRGEIEFAVRHGRPKTAKISPLSPSANRRGTQSPASRDRAPPLHVILLILGLAPFAAVLSWGSSATKASSQGESHMNSIEDWRRVHDFWFPPDLAQADAATFRRRAE